MAATFTKNRSKILPILERNLATVVPRLYSVGLISEQDRDVALIATVDSNTRAAALTRAVEGKVLNYHELLVFVYAVVSSRIDVAERDVIKSLAYLPECVKSTRRQSYCEFSTCTSKSTSRVHRRLSSDSRFVLISKNAMESLSMPPSSDTTLQSNAASSASLPGATSIDLPETETEFVDHDETVEESIERDMEEVLKNSSTWSKHAQKFPGIKFSNYFTKQVVTYGGGIISGDGIQIRIPGRAIKKEDSVEFTIQACIDGPFDFPEDVNLITPVYVISPHYEFQREVTVLMDSFVRLHPFENNLVFLTSPTKREVDEYGSHWKFEISERKPRRDIDGANERRIVLEVTHFCLLSFGFKKKVPRYDYRVSLHSPLTSIDDKLCPAIFSVTLHHEVFSKNLRVHLESFGNKLHGTCEAPVHLTQDEVILCLPNDDTSNPSQRFQIVADKNKILKSAIDNPTRSWKHKKRATKDPESYPPRIALTVLYTKRVRSPTHCQLHFQGIQEVDSFNMIIPSGYFKGTVSAAGNIEECTLGPNNDPRLRMSNLLNLTLKTNTCRIQEYSSGNWRSIHTVW